MSLFFLWGGAVGVSVVVPNLYLVALRAAKVRAVLESSSLRYALLSAETAWGSGVWVGGQALVFEQLLAGESGQATSSAGAAFTEFDQAISVQYDQVESMSWQARWRNV